MQNQMAASQHSLSFVSLHTNLVFHSNAHLCQDYILWFDRITNGIRSCIDGMLIFGMGLISVTAKNFEKVEKYLPNCGDPK